jgi:hypothetical protein
MMRTGNETGPCVAQAVHEGASEQAEENVARMKKQATAEADEALAGKGRLPALLRQGPDQAAA